MSELGATTPPGPPPRVPGHELLRRIGKGSYGEVWLARCALGHFRAVKIIRRAAFNDDRPYEREFTGLKNFEPVSREHEGLVDILQVERNDAAGHFYCVMELAQAQAQNEDGGLKMEDGGPFSILHPPSSPRTSHPPSSILAPENYRPLTLEAIIHAQGRLPVPECVRIAATLADALRYLHERGLVHRDIKPSNIIFLDGVPKLADVGLVALAESARTFVGTEGFVPPEGPGTVKADIYSLGKCIYEMAMGKDRQAFPSPPTLLDELPDRAALLELNEIITRACDPDPKQRYETAAEMLAELEELGAGRSVQKARAANRRRRLLKRLGTVAAALLLIGGGALFFLSRPHLQVTRTLEMPAEWRAHPPLVGDWDGDGTPDLYLVGGKHVWVVSATGEMMNDRPLDTPAVISGDLVVNSTGHKSSDLFLHWREGTNLHLGVFNYLFAEVKQFRAQGAPLKDRAGHYSSVLMACDVVDLKNDGHPALIAARFTGFAKQPRDFCCYDYESGELRWLHPVAPGPGNVVFADMDGDGMLDLLCGSRALNNTNKLEDGTDDSHSYLYAISGEGKKLWTRQVGGPFSTCEPVMLETGGSERKAVFAAVSRAKKKNEDGDWSAFGFISKTDARQGAELKRYEVGTQINTVLAANLDASDEPKLLVTDDQGFLHELDSDLNLCRRQAIAPRLHDCVFLHLVAVADLDGDGQQELLFTSQQIRYLSNQDSVGLNGKPTPMRAFDNCLLVCGADLKLRAKYVLRAMAKRSRDLGHRAYRSRPARKGHRRPLRQSFVSALHAPPELVAAPGVTARRKTADALNSERETRNAKLTSQAAIPTLTRWGYLLPRSRASSDRGT